MDPTSMLLSALHFVPGYTETQIISGRMSDIEEEIPIFEGIVELITDQGSEVISRLFGSDAEALPSYTIPIYNKCMMSTFSTLKGEYQYLGLMIRWAKNSSGESKEDFIDRVEADPDKAVEGKPSLAIPYEYTWKLQPYQDEQQDSSLSWWIRYLMGKALGGGRGNNGCLYRIPSNESHEVDWCRVVGWWSKKGVLIPDKSHLNIWNARCDSMVMLAMANPNDWYHGDIDPRASVTGLFSGWIDPFSDAANYLPGGKYGYMMPSQLKDTMSGLPKWMKQQTDGKLSATVRLPFVGLGAGLDVAANLRGLWPSMTSIVSAWSPTIPEVGKGEVQKIPEVEQTALLMDEALQGILPPEDQPLINVFQWNPAALLTMKISEQAEKEQEEGGGGAALLLGSLALAAPFLLR